MNLPINNVIAVDPVRGLVRYGDVYYIIAGPRTKTHIGVRIAKYADLKRYEKSDHKWVRDYIATLKRKETGGAGTEEPPPYTERTFDNLGSVNRAANDTLDAITSSRKSTPSRAGTEEPPPIDEEDAELPPIAKAPKPTSGASLLAMLRRDSGAGTEEEAPDEG